jgi:hypothetical protein
MARRPKIQTTELGYHITQGNRDLFVNNEEALRFWIMLGVAINGRLSGGLDRATAGGLTLLSAHYADETRKHEQD